MKRLCIGLVCLLGLSATAVAESPDAHADQDAVIKRLSEGLKLLSEGKDDAWISGFCSKAELCRNDRTISSLKQYNLPAAHGTARNCFKEKFVVTRRDGDAKTDAKVKIFLDCHTGGLPVPFHMVKEDGTWNFSKI